MYDWDFRVVFQYKWVFVQGAWITLKITFFSIIFGSAVGGLVGLGRTLKTFWARLPFAVYTELFLALPIFVLLIWIYYCGPILLKVNLNGFWTAVLTLSLTLSAYVAEIVRSGLQSVPTGQVEAAKALGMNKLQALRCIVIPQSIRVMTPPLLSMYISTLKMSSLASVIAVYELLHAAQNLILTSFRPLEIYTTVAFFYLLMVFPFALITRRFESSKIWRLT